jgi:hypothetical protein
MKIIWITKWIRQNQTIWDGLWQEIANGLTKIIDNKTERTRIWIDDRTQLA